MVTRTLVVRASHVRLCLPEDLYIAKLEHYFMPIMQEMEPQVSLAQIGGALSHQDFAKELLMRAEEQLVRLSADYRCNIHSIRTRFRHVRHAALQVVSVSSELQGLGDHDTYLYRL